MQSVYTPPFLSRLSGARQIPSGVTERLPISRRPASPEPASPCRRPSRTGCSNWSSTTPPQNRWPRQRRLGLAPPWHAGQPTGRIRKRKNRQASRASRPRSGSFRSQARPLTPHTTDLAAVLLHTEAAAGPTLKSASRNAGASNAKARRSAARAVQPPRTGSPRWRPPSPDGCPRDGGPTRPARFRAK